MSDASAQRKSDEESNSEETQTSLPARVDLESLYLTAVVLPDLDDRASVLSLVGDAYYGLYKVTTDQADLEKAISIHEEAIGLTSVSYKWHIESTIDG